MAIQLQYKEFIYNTQITTRIKCQLLVLDQEDCGLDRHAKISKTVPKMTETLILFPVIDSVSGD